MTIEKLVELLISKSVIDKDGLIEFGKICQYHALNQIYQKEDEDETIRLLKNEIIQLRNDLNFDNNKHHILTKNYSLN